jgi:hypothetical protein
MISAHMVLGIEGDGKEMERRKGRRGEGRKKKRKAKLQP